MRAECARMRDGQTEGWMVTEGWKDLTIRVTDWAPITGGGALLRWRCLPPLDSGGGGGGGAETTGIETAGRRPLCAAWP